MVALKPDFLDLGRRSVTVDVPVGGAPSHFLISLATFADTIAPWGSSPNLRDRQLRDFWPTEPWLASTIASVASRNAAFSWRLEGPPRVCDRLQEMLHRSDFGRGWQSLILKLSIDLYTQDNGAFVEVVREGDRPDSPILWLEPLDAGRCTRTGNREYPVLYTDREGRVHKLAWFQLVDFTDFPSPIETMNGMQECAVSRVLRYAQILRDVAVMQNERVGGRFTGAVHLVSGIQTQVIEDALKQSAEGHDTRGYARFERPVILGTLDPTAQVKVDTLMLKSLPEGFDIEKDMKWYIAVLALGFGCDYQDLAPLPGGGLGTSAQSEILHLKSKGKGPELFMKMVEHKLNFSVLPQNVTFSFDEKDVEFEAVEAGVKKQRAEALKVYVDAGIFTPQVARQVAQDNGDLKTEYLEMMTEPDVTPEGQVSDEERQQEAPTPAASPPEEMPVGGAPLPLTKAAEVDLAVWERKRQQLEREFGGEMEAVLASMREQVVKRIKREVREAGL